MKNPKLYEPFPWEEIEYRVMRKSQDGQKAQFAFYLTSRMVMDRLEEAGCEWSDEYTLLPDGKHVECRLTVDGVTRADVGEPNEGGRADELKGAYSDALKRAAVKFGVGRYLYGSANVWIEIDKWGEPLDTNKVRMQYARLLSGPAAPPAAARPEPQPEPPAQRQPAPARQNGAPVFAKNITAFWTKAKALGYASPEVLDIAGGTVAGWSDDELDGLLAELEARKEEPASRS